MCRASKSLFENHSSTLTPSQIGHVVARLKRSSVGPEPLKGRTDPMQKQPKYMLRIASDKSSRSGEKGWKHLKFHQHSELGNGIELEAHLSAGHPFSLQRSFKPRLQLISCATVS
jgi:hypothetical protein